MVIRLDIGIKQSKFYSMKIIRILRFIFIILLFLELIIHSYININIGRFLIDYISLIIILLIISLSIDKLIFSCILILYIILICLFIFSPMFISDDNLEKIYYSIFLGRELSSYIRLNIINIYWIVNPIMNLSFYLAGYIIFLEIPFRVYKRKIFPFSKS